MAHYNKDTEYKKIGFYNKVGGECKKEYAKISKKVGKIEEIILFFILDAIEKFVMNFSEIFIGFIKQFASKFC